MKQDPNPGSTIRPSFSTKRRMVVVGNKQLVPLPHTAISEDRSTSPSVHRLLWPLSTARGTTPDSPYSTPLLRPRPIMLVRCVLSPRPLYDRIEFADYKTQEVLFVKVKSRAILLESKKSQSSSLLSVGSDDVTSNAWHFLSQRRNLPRAGCEPGREA